MSLLGSLKDLSIYESQMTENEDLIEIRGEVESQKLLEIARTALHLTELQEGLRLRFTSSLILPEHKDSIRIGFSYSFTKVDVEIIPQDVLELLETHQDLKSIHRILAINRDGELCAPSEYLDLIEQDKSELTSRDFVWDIAISIPKKPFAEAFRKECSAGTNIEVVVFVSRTGLVRFLTDDIYQALFTKALSGSGNLVLAVGGLGTTLIGRFLVMTELWETPANLTDVLSRMSSPGELNSRYRFLKEVTSLGVRDDLVLPDFFELANPQGREENAGLLSTLQVLEALHSLLSFSSYAIREGPGQWVLRVIGAKTLESRLGLVKGALQVDGNPAHLDVSSLIVFYRWAFLDGDRTKVSLARKTIALQSSDIAEFLKAPADVRKSAEAAYDLYLEEAVAEVLEIKQRFTEYLFDWSSKDIELKLKLDAMVSDTTLGGVGSLLAAIVGLVTQPVQPAASGVVLFVVPIVFVLYLLLLSIRLRHLDGTCDVYLKEHSKQLKYYTGILGKDSVDEVVGDRTPDALKKEFSKRKDSYQRVFIVLGVIDMAAWVCFLLLGFFAIH